MTPENRTVTGYLPLQHELPQLPMPQEECLEALKNGGTALQQGWLYTPISPAYLALESSKHERGEQWEEELRRCAIEGGLDFPVIQTPSGSYKRVFPLVAVACIFVLDFGMESVTCMRFRQR